MADEAPTIALHDVQDFKENTDNLTIMQTMMMMWTISSRIK